MTLLKRKILLLSTAALAGTIGISTTVWGETGSSKPEIVHEVSGSLKEQYTVEDKVQNTETVEQAKKEENTSEVYRKQMTFFKTASKQEPSVNSQFIEGQYQSSSKPNGPRNYKYTYDANGRLTHVDTGKRRIRYSYDSNGNLLRKTIEELAELPVTEPEEQATLPNLGEITRLGTLRIWDSNGKEGILLNSYGWYLSEKEVEKVEYYFNDTLLLGESTYGLNDEATYSKYPEYDNHNAGFKFTIDLISKVPIPLLQKEYKISVVIKHKDGSLHKLEKKNVNLKKSYYNSQYGDLFLIEEYFLPTITM